MGKERGAFDKDVGWDSPPEGSIWSLSGETGRSAMFADAVVRRRLPRAAQARTHRLRARSSETCRKERPTDVTSICTERSPQSCVFLPPSITQNNDSGCHQGAPETAEPRGTRSSGWRAHQLRARAGCAVQGAGALALGSAPWEVSVRLPVRREWGRELPRVLADRESLARCQGRGKCCLGQSLGR